MIFLRGFIRSRRVLVCVAMLVAAAIAGGAIHMAMQPRVEAAEPLSAYVPQGSLMAVESPDFGALLAAWTNSSEEKAWIKSDSYEEFSHSRLFSRLGEAQSEFAASAGLAPDAKFLSQVAGRESLFAWYDIGRLEFLYVTRMPPGSGGEQSVDEAGGQVSDEEGGIRQLLYSSGGEPGSGGRSGRPGKRDRYGADGGVCRAWRPASAGDAGGLDRECAAAGAAPGRCDAEE